MVENVNTTSMCCPRLIKREKPMENVKNSCVPPWVTFQSLKTTKMEVWESGEEEGVAGLSHADLISWSYHPYHSYLQNCHSTTQIYKNAKLPLYHSYLQNCHSTTQIYKNATLGLKCWPIDFADVEMTWKWCGDSLQLNIDVEAPKLFHPNT